MALPFSKVCPGGSFFTSWSGGKDSSLALYRAIAQGAKSSALLTMMIEDGQRSRSHGLPRSVLEAQARCLDIPIRFCSTSWPSYTANFKKELNALKESDIGCGVFGDIDLENHRLWVEGVCSEAGVQPWLPLWKEPRTTLLNELLSGGFRAEIIAVKDGVLSPDFLGRTLDKHIVDEFCEIGIDLCGEAGEYHTVVTDGPIFNYPLAIEHGQKVLKDGYWFLDVSVLTSAGIR